MDLFSVAGLKVLSEWIQRISSSRSSDLREIEAVVPEVMPLTRCYVEPNVQARNPADSDEEDPSADIRQSAFEYLNTYFQRDFQVREGRNQLFILGDAGTGKSSLLAMIRLAQLKKIWPGHVSMRLFKIDESVVRRIGEIKDQANTILLLDALDEGSLAMQSNNFEVRVAELLSATDAFKRVLISCRTQFFPQGTKDPFNNTGRVVIKGRTCPAVFISLFGDVQVDLFLKKKFGKRRELIVRAKRLVARMKSLRFRPLLLCYVEDIIHSDSGQVFDALTEADIYQQLVMAWLMREEVKLSKYFGSTVTHAQLLEACCNLACWMNSNNKISLSSAVLDMLIDNGVIRHGKLITAIGIGGRSLMNKNSDGDYRFSHYTIMEFLVAYGLKHDLLPGELRRDRRPAEQDESKGGGGREPKLHVTQTIYNFIDKNDYIGPDLIFSGLSLVNHDFSGKDLSGVDLSSSDLTGADFSKCNLTRANFDESILDDANFSGAILTDATIRSASVFNANFLEAVWESIYVSGTPHLLALGLDHDLIIEEPPGVDHGDSY